MLGYDFELLIIFVEHGCFATCWTPHKTDQYRLLYIFYLSYSPVQEMEHKQQMGFLTVA